MFGFFNYKDFIGWCVDVEGGFYGLYWDWFIFVDDVVDVVFFVFCYVVFLVVGVGVGFLVWVVFVDIFGEQVVVGVGYVQCVVDENFDFYFWYLVVNFFDFIQ